MHDSDFPAFAETAAIPAFTPVPLTRSRRDGWTPERQRSFIAALARTGCVERAARAVGMSVTSAYKLRRRREAESFSAAWVEALADARRRAFEFAMDQALTADLQPRLYRGHFTGTIVRADDTRAILLALRAASAMGLPKV